MGIEMLLGRTSELKYLNSYYERDDSQIMVVYGKKNVGKMALLCQFMKDKPGYYYRARSASEREQRYHWGNELGRETNKISKYPAFTEIFQSVVKNESGKNVIVIDEFQHIIKSSDDFMKELIQFVNESKVQIMMILCSSSIGWVENSMIRKIGTSAYELSGFLKIRELDFESMRKFFSGFSMKQSIETYAVLGGIPGFWKYFDDKLGIKENICEFILKKGAFLHEEGQRIVEEELRETGVYNTILASIAAGHYKLNDLYLHTEFSRAKISVYLKNLMELELVEKDFSQKGAYRIKSHFLHFYFTYLYPNLSDLEILPPDIFYDQYIGPVFKTYVAEYFKRICKQRMEKWNKQGMLPFKVGKIGEWTGKEGNIDIIAQNEKGETIIGICNWERSIAHYDDYEWLLFCAEKARLQTDYIYLFSISRFDEKLNLEAKVKQNLKLINMDEI